MLCHSGHEGAVHDSGVKFDHDASLYHEIGSKRREKLVRKYAILAIGNVTVGQYENHNSSI